MKKAGNILWGIVLVAVGVILALNVLNITNIDIFFEGWWTLFIIIPSVIGLFTDSEKTGSVIGIVIGALLLLCARGVLSYSMLWKLIVPAVIVIIGLRLIFKALFVNKASRIIKQLKSEGRDPRVGCATFSGCNMDFSGESFEGAELSATFGSVKCDLRNAVIEGDCAIRVSAVFGSVDILVPEGLNVRVSSNSIFGGASAKETSHNNAPTLYVNANCVFGGVEIK